jgi:hypothetical protein
LFNEISKIAFADIRKVVREPRLVVGRSLRRVCADELARERIEPASLRYVQS